MIYDFQPRTSRIVSANFISCVSHLVNKLQLGNAIAGKAPAFRGVGVTGARLCPIGSGAAIGEADRTLEDGRMCGDIHQGAAA